MPFQGQPDPQLVTKTALLRRAKTQFGTEMVPRPPNLEPKLAPRPPTFFFNRYAQINWLDPQLEAKMDPKTENLEPRWLLIPNLEPRWLPTFQLGAKVAPKTPNKKLK